MTTRSDLSQVTRRASTRRTALRIAATAGIALGLTMLTSAAALAAGPDVNGVKGHSPSLGIVNIILIFAVLPVGVLLVISLIFLRPGTAPGAHRYRPGRGWNANPTWIGVPAREHHGAPALEGAEALQEQAGHHPHDTAEEPSAARRDPTVGGARGSW